MVADFAGCRTPDDRYQQNAIGRTEILDRTLADGGQPLLRSNGQEDVPKPAGQPAPTELPQTPRGKLTHPPG